MPTLWQEPDQRLAPLSIKSMAAGKAEPIHRCTPDPVKHPWYWIWVNMAKNRWFPSWWCEFRSLYKDKVTDWLTDNMVQQITRKKAAACRLPTVQEEVVGWWEAPLSIHGLGQQDFLPHHDFCSTRDSRETWKEGTLVLAKALQHCVERLVCLSGCYATQWGSPEVHGAPYAPQSWWHPGSLNMWHHRQQARSIPNPSRSCTLGQGSHIPGG